MKLELSGEREMLSGGRRFNANKARLEEILTFFFGSIGERLFKGFGGRVRSSVRFVSSSALIFEKRFQLETIPTSLRHAPELTSLSAF